MGSRAVVSAKLGFKVFFVRALAEHLPVPDPLVPTAVNPEFCYSELRRKRVLRNPLLALRSALMDLVFARTAEVHSRQLL